MQATPKRIAPLLPRGWPNRVRSAVVHAISMSNVVFAVTRSDVRDAEALHHVAHDVALSAAGEEESQSG